MNNTIDQIIKIGPFFMALLVCSTMTYIFQFKQQNIAYERIKPKFGYYMDKIPCSVEVLDVQLDKSKVSINDDIVMSIVVKYYERGLPFPDELYASLDPDPTVSNIEYERIKNGYIKERLEKKDTECQIILDINAPAFEVSPSKNINKTIVFTGNQEKILLILKPMSMGNKTIILDEVYTTDSESKVFSVSVVNTFGLKIKTAESMSLVVSFLAFVLMLPWVKQTIENLIKSKSSSKRRNR